MKKHNISMHRSEITLVGLQLKSMAKLKLLAKLLTTMETEFGIRTVYFSLEHFFICDDIDLKQVDANDQMQKLMRELIIDEQHRSQAKHYKKKYSSRPSRASKKT